MTTEPNDNELLTAGQAAAILGVDRTTLHRWGNQGRVKYVELTGSNYRRYRRRDLAGLVREVDHTDTQEQP